MRLRWVGYVCLIDVGCNRNRLMKTELPGNRKRVRSKRFTHVVKADKRAVGVVYAKICTVSDKEGEIMSECIRGVAL